MSEDVGESSVSIMDKKEIRSEPRCRANGWTDLHSAVRTLIQKGVLFEEWRAFVLT